MSLGDEMPQRTVRRPSQFDVGDGQVLNTTYRFEAPRTAALRDALLACPRSSDAVADLLFLEAWEARLAQGVAAILRARQIRRANATLAARIRDELARAQPRAHPTTGIGRPPCVTADRSFAGVAAGD